MNFNDILYVSSVFLICFVLPQRGSDLCGHCHYEDVLKWTTGSSPGFICSRTPWRNWTSLTVHASPQAAWLHSGISSNYPNTPNVAYLFKPKHYWCVKFLHFCVLQRTAAAGCVIPPWDIKSWVGHYTAGGDVTTVSDHCYWLRLQPESGGRGG